MTDSKDMLRTLYRSSPNAVVVTNNAREVTGLNPAAERLFGHGEAELVGTSSQTLYADPRDFDQLGETHFHRHAAEISRSYTARYRAKSGRIFDGETTASAIISSTGERDGFICIIRDVTAELSLQARLEASDLQLRVALSSANEGTFSLNVVSGLGSTRGFINEFLGIKSADATISLARWTEALHEDDRDEFLEAIDRLRKQPTTGLDTVHRARRADGAWRWLQTRGRVSEFASDGTPLRISGIIADVTERRALEVKLAEREQQLENAIAAGSAGIWEIDPAVPGAVAIGPIRDMLGVPDKPELIERDIWLDQVHPDERDAVNTETMRLLRGETDSLDIEYRLRDIRSGEWVWLRASGQRIRKDKQHPIISGVLIDITEQKAMAERLTRNEQMVREAMASVRDGVWSADLQRETVRISGFLVDLLKIGAPNEELPIKDWLASRLFADSHRGAERLANLKQAPMTGNGPAEINTVEYRMTNDDGEIVWVRSRGRVIEWDENGRPLRAAGTHSDITEEKRLQTELERRDLQFRDALAATNEGAWRINLKTRISDVTAVISEMIGLPPRDARIARDELVSRIHPDDRPIAEASFMKLDSGEAGTVDYTVRFHSQMAGWIHIHSRGRVSGRDPQGRPLIATGFLSDVTERLETKQRLEEREQQLTDAIQATALGIFRIDVEAAELWLRGNIAEELFNSGAETRVATQAWLDRVHPDDLERVTKVTTALFRGTETVAVIDYRMRDSEGRWIWYQVTGRIVEADDTGRVRNISGVIWNIDTQKRLNHALLEERERFEATYRATPAMMHTIDASGTIREVSDYWLSHLGYSRDEVIGRKSTDFLDPESGQRAVETSLPELFQSGRNTDIPYRFIRKDGTKLDVLLSSFLERDQDGNPLHSYAVITDVTPLRAAYAQLERTNAELDRFATVASHDLQEPLRKVAAFAGLIRRRYTGQLDEDGTRSLDYLVDAAQRMQRLIDDLLSYSRMSSQSLRLQPVDLDALMADVVDQLDAAISESGAQLEIAALPTIRADPLLMRQVLQNLVSNAIKYRGAEAPHIEIRAHCDREAWTVSVTDNGIGIDPKFFEKIFAPFQRLHSREAYSGTGIGLAIVRQAVERHDGRIWVESAEGQGSRFCFSIPIHYPSDGNGTA
ncbi:PAS domain S-box-containing protein [Maricaulis salignorans]|uniref:histidine kinase n=2 Tax=Maricaulis salignorans TaxID=144026 RepID=A0A1G9W806_9PROT|nr:PAS domain S-box-containing protein [Maricaulis salignorans]